MKNTSIKLGFIDLILDSEMEILISMKVYSI